jgi:hypothetical protein
VSLALFGAYVTRAGIGMADASILDPEVRAFALCCLLFVVLCLKELHASRRRCSLNSLPPSLLVSPLPATHPATRQVFAGLLVGAMLP